MPRFPSVGQELLDVPLPDMVTKLAMGIASAQTALDENSVHTAILLATTKVNVVLAVTQTIAADGTVSFKDDQAEMSLLQIGLIPTFYQFAEASIEVTMDIKTTTSSETDVKVSATAKVGFRCWIASVTADVSHNRKFQKEVRGTSRLVVRLLPVPPPERIKPQFTMIDNRPPQVVAGTVVTVTPVTVTLKGGETQTFTANVPVTWSIPTGASGSIDAKGVYTAPPTITTAGSVTVTATSIADATKTATATITLTV